VKWSKYVHTSPNNLAVPSGNRNKEFYWETTSSNRKNPRLPRSQTEAQLLTPSRPISFFVLSTFICLCFCGFIFMKFQDQNTQNFFSVSKSPLILTSVIYKSTDQQKTANPFLKTQILMEKVCLIVQNL
jgi:hypothetical protein